jgi:hypothetical protein
MNKGRRFISLITSSTLWDLMSAMAGGMAAEGSTGASLEAWSAMMCGEIFMSFRPQSLGIEMGDQRTLGVAMQ